MSSTSSHTDQDTRRDAALVASILAAITLALGARALSEHPVIVASTLATIAPLTLCAMWTRAKAKDWLAARTDPPRGGLVIGTRQGNWAFARARPYTLGWDSFHQHVLITGPTGRGKSYSFIDPILRAQIRRPQTGVLYIDGKGDPVHTGPNAVPFDHVFSPDTPHQSACWNPLAGPDPIAQARSFADALFPEAAQPGAVYYEARGAFTIRAVAPAIAYTGLGLDKPPSASEEQIRKELLAAGLTAKDADHVITHKGIGVCEDQLRWLPTRAKKDPASLLSYIVSNNRPSPAIGDQLLMPRAGHATIAALHHVLFTDGKLEELADRLDGQLDRHAPQLARERFGLLSAQIRSLAELPSKERASVLSNLENRLSVFLTAPFDRLCSRSDFNLADPCNGTAIAMLLPTGSFPGIAEPLGRAALSQFQQAVLASDPKITKVAVLDEFHNFASPAFTKFLAQARSKGGAAVMSTQTIADFHPDYRDRLLANASTQILTPGALPFDADHWSAAFGSELVEQQSTSVQKRTLVDPRPLPTVRTDMREMPRYTATEISELPAGSALIRQVCGRTQYPAVIANVERRV